MSSQWIPFDVARPDGSQQTGPGFHPSVRNNGYALWTAIMMGMMHGWDVAVSGGTAEQPTQFLFTEEGSPNNQRVRATVTWGTTGGQNGNITQIQWAVSQDTGANYTNAPAATVISYDSSGNFTGMTGASGMFGFIAYLLGKAKAINTRLTSAESTIASLQGMAFQDESAVAITGGTAKGVVLGGTGAGEAKLAYLLAPIEKWSDLGTGTPTNTFTFDFAAATMYKITVGNNFTFAVTNEPPAGWGEKVVVEVNGALGFHVTLPSGYSWGGAGEPAWTAGPDLVTIYCRNHASSPVKRAMLSSYGP